MLSQPNLTKTTRAADHASVHGQIKAAYFRILLTMLARIKNAPAQAEIAAAVGRSQYTELHTPTATEVTAVTNDIRQTLFQ